MIFVFFQAIGSRPSRKRSLKRSESNGRSTFALHTFPCPSKDSVSVRLMNKIGKGSDPDEELAFMRAILCSMYVLSRDSSGMSYKGGWLGLCCKARLILDPFLYLPPGPGGMAMSVGVICLVRNLLLRAWCTQGSLGTRSFGALVCFGVSF